MTKPLAAFAALTILTGAAFAGEGGSCCGGAPAKSAATVAKCPVSKEAVKSTASAPKSTYQAKTYYFCCTGCKTKFDKTPAKYAAKTSTKS